MSQTQQQIDALREATKRHREQEMLVRGTYGEGDDGAFRGCSIGCLAREIGESGAAHEAVAEHYGYPEWLAHLQDSLFENASTEVHVQLAEAMHPRDDDGWQQVMHAIHWRILNEVTLPNAGEAEAAVREVMRLHEQREPTESAAWSAAQSAARSAARSAAQSVARSANSAAWSANSTAWSAARSAAWSAVQSAAQSVAWWAAQSVAQSVASWETILRITLEEVAR